jgi:opacity protein-like surface antigen
MIDAWPGVGDGRAGQVLSFSLSLSLRGRSRVHGNLLAFGWLTTGAAAACHAGPLSLAPGSATPTASLDPIQALDPKGLYASFGAGAGWPQPVHYSDDRLGPLLPIRGEVLANPGFAFERGLGYDFGRLRGELSWVRRQATIDDSASSWSVGPFRPIVSRDSPKLSSNSGFASLYADLPIEGTRLIPYLGGGLGFTALQTSPTTLQLRRFRSSFGGSGNLPAYQAKAGLAYRSSPRTDLFAEAVFQGSPSRSQGSLVRSSLTNWGLRFGLRWRFGGAVKAAAPVATP